MRKATVHDLEKTWWWREAVATGEWFGFIPGDGIEHASFSWELLRRWETAPELPPFPGLSRWDQMGLKRIFGKRLVAWPCTYGEVVSRAPETTLPSTWDLTMNDHVLVSVFRDFIRQQRDHFGIESKPGRASETSKLPAWRLVELLDLSHHHARAKAVLAHDRDFDKRAYFKARGHSKKAWKILISKLAATRAKQGGHFLTDYLTK